MYYYHRERILVAPLQTHLPKEQIRGAPPTEECLQASPTPLFLHYIIIARDSFHGHGRQTYVRHLSILCSPVSE